MPEQQRPMAVIVPHEISVEPLPAFELILDDGRRIKLWPSGHTEGLDGKVIVINRVHAMFDQILEVLQTNSESLHCAVTNWLLKPQK